MIVIIGDRKIKADGDVQVDYMNGRTGIYNSEKTKHLILNPDLITAVVINEKEEVKII
jgi:hypothetical protein